MPNVIYCAKCGRELSIYRKPMPQFSRIINLLEPHRCCKVVEPDLGKPASIPKPIRKDHEFVQKLNDLNPPEGDKRSKENLRNELVTSSAPSSLQDVARFANTVPEGDADEEPDEVA